VRMALGAEAASNGDGGAQGSRVVSVGVGLSVSLSRCSRPDPLEPVVRVAAMDASTSGDDRPQWFLVGSCELTCRRGGHRGWILSSRSEWLKESGQTDSDGRGPWSTCLNRSWTSVRPSCLSFASPSSAQVYGPHMLLPGALTMTPYLLLRRSVDEFRSCKAEPGRATLPQRTFGSRPRALEATFPTAGTTLRRLSTLLSPLCAPGDPGGRRRVTPVTGAAVTFAAQGGGITDPAGTMVTTTTRWSMP